MMSLLISTLLLSRADAAGNYAAFVKAHPAFKVHVEASVNGKTVSTGDLLAERPERVLYKARGGRFDYVVSQTEKGYVEIENSRKIYDEFQPLGRLGVWDSDISATANALVPRFLFMPSLRSIFQKLPEPTASGQNQLLYEKSSSPLGVSELWVTVAPDGRIVNVRHKVTSPRGTRDTVWTLSGYAYPSNLSLSSFQAIVPTGYVPNSVPRLDTPLQLGQRAPLTGWVDKNGRSVDLGASAGHKPLLIAYIAPDEGPAAASLASLRRLEGKVPVFVVGPGGLQSGRNLKVLSPPGAPMFYLIGADGKVAKIWFGYNRADPSTFEADVLAAASGSPSNGKTAH